MSYHLTVSDKDRELGVVERGLDSTIFPQLPFRASHTLLPSIPPSTPGPFSLLAWERLVVIQASPSPTGPLSAPQAFAHGPCGCGPFSPLHQQTLNHWSSQLTELLKLCKMLSLLWHFPSPLGSNVYFLLPPAAWGIPLLCGQWLGIVRVCLLICDPRGRSVQKARGSGRQRAWCSQTLETYHLPSSTPSISFKPDNPKHPIPICKMGYSYFLELQDW